MLSPKDRLVDVDLQRFIDEELYWVLHAPRQTGKTSFLMSWMEELNQTEDFLALYVSVEACQGVEDSAQAIPTICSTMRKRMELNLDSKYWVERPTNTPANDQLFEMLNQFAIQAAPKRVVMLFDEVDVLSGQALISFLRQLRSGFAGRGMGKFPVSVALVGMRDLRDYLVGAKDGIPVNPGSPFNIKEISHTLRNFSFAEIQELLGQHTSATGQIFETQALELLYDYTQGQPWLVNSLAKECVLYLCKKSENITPDHIEKAKERLIKSRAVHIDSLAERLKDPRIKAVIQPILIGAVDPELANREAFELCIDLGLVSIIRGTPQISNPIYREVLIRTLNYSHQLAIAEPEFKWQKDNGDLDMEALMREFQEFWRWNSEAWEEKADYTEAFPHLLLMAFFQRILNGGAKLTREVAVGRERIDMLIEWQNSKHIIEIKLVHPKRGRASTLETGLRQIASYADKVKPDTQTLVLFDRTEWGCKATFEEKTQREEQGSVVVWWL